MNQRRYIWTLIALIMSTDVRAQTLTWQDTLYNFLHNNGLPEDTLVGSSIGYIKAVSNIPIMYGVESNSYLSVNQSTGAVILLQRLFYDIVPQFDITFSAENSFDKIITNYTVNVRQVANAGPSFLSTPYIVQVMETASVGSYIYSSIFIKDKDPNANLSLSCFSESQMSCDPFVIISKSDAVNGLIGSIQLTKLLNFVAQPNYTFTLQATDTGTVVRTAKTTLLISVQPAQGPFFINTPIIFTVTEFTPVGFLVGTVKARAKNSNNLLSLSLSQDPYFKQGNMVYDQDLLSLTVLVKTNFSAVDTNGARTLLIKATEIQGGLAPNLVVETNITIIIIDLNDYKPSFSQPSYTINLPEQAPMGTIINNTGISVMDPDLGNNSFFELFISNNYGVFGILPLSAYGYANISVIVTTPVSAYLDYENEFYRVQVYGLVAYESRTVEGYSSTASLTISLVNVDEYRPSFAYDRFEYAVPADRPAGTYIGTIKASDADAGVFGEVFYSISGSFSSLFFINNATGELSVANDLNSYVGQVINLNYTAVDGGGLSTSVIVAISIAVPVKLGIVFSQVSYLTSLPEDSTVFTPNTTISAAVVGSSSPSIVTYQIIDGNTNGAFVIDAVSGLLSVKRPITYRETPQQMGQFQLTVQAEVLTSSPRLSATVSVIVNIINSNNHPPVFSQSTYEASVSELANGGTFVLRVAASTINTGIYAQIGYNIISGDYGKFSIDFNGIISIVPNAVLLIADFGSKYTLQVRAFCINRNQLTGTSTVIITIQSANLNPPVFVQSLYVAFIADTAPVGTTVVTVSATDPDKTANVVYYILTNGTTTGKDNTGSPLSNNTMSMLQNAFQINNRTGLITNRIILLNATVAEVTLQVIAEDLNAQGGKRQVTSVPVTVSIESSSNTIQFVQPWTTSNPEFSLNIAEHEPIGTVVALLCAVDTITGSLVSRYQKVDGTDPNNYFQVLSTSGAVVVNKDIVYNSLPSKQLTFDMRAYGSNNNNSVLAHVTVSVWKVGIDSPQFSQNAYSVRFSDGSREGTSVDRIQATDTNIAPFNNLTYSLSGIGSANFILTSNGTVVIAPGASLINSYYGLFVTATNNAADPTMRLSATAALQVYVDIAPNTAPYFLRVPYYQFVIKDTVPIGDFVGQVTAATASGSLSYNISTENNTLFRIGSSSGFIVTSANLFGLASDVPIIIEVVATNDGKPPQSAKTNVIIYIINDQSSLSSVSLTFPAYDGQIVPIKEEIPIGSNITQLKGYSSIAGHQVSYRFQLDSYVTSDESYFYLNYTSGALVSAKRLDRETQDTYLLIVMAVDGEYETARRLVIQLTDINDNNPTFDKCTDILYQNPIEVHVAEEQVAPLPVLTVHACDADYNNSIFYFFVDCNTLQLSHEDKFQINKVSGLISTTSKLDYESQQQFHLCIIASNSENGATYSNTSVQQVTVLVDNINDNGPSFAGLYGPTKTIVAGVLTAVSYGTRIVRVSAIDPDIQTDTSIRYTITGQYYGNGITADPPPFLVNADTGDITSALSSYINYLGQHFTVNITATDSQGSSDTAYVKIFVVQETDQLQYTIGISPENLRDNVTLLLNDVSQSTSGYKLYAQSLRYSASDQGKILYYSDSVLNFDAALSKLGSSNTALQPIYNKYSILATQRCVSKMTTRYWSGYWWLWWLLIALALLILLLTLILLLIVCIWWCRNGCKRITKQSTPLVVLWDQQMPSDVPDQSLPDDFEWQEQIVHVK